MKQLLILLSVAIAFSACSKKNDNTSNNDNVAALNLPGECQGPVDYAQSQNWNMYRRAGCSPYQWGSTNQINANGCEYGMIPACGNGVGMICVPASSYSNRSIAWFDYRGHGRFSGYGRYGRRSNRRGYDQANTIGRTCIAGQLNSCIQGYCQPLDNSGIGVCVQ